MINMKKSLKKSMFSLLFLSLIVAIKAQDVLNLEQAIANTLKNNFDIKLAENNQEIAKNNTAVLNAGFLPTLSVGANGNYSIRDTKVELNDGRKAGITDVNGVTYQTSVNLNYLIFDGLGRYYNLQKFKEQHQLSQLQAQFVIENTLLQMTQQFYKVCQQYQTIENLEKTLSISKDRLKKEQYDFDFGQNSKLDVLNASVDFNIDSINLLQATNQLSNDKLILKSY